MTILSNIDGVLATTSPWQKVVLPPDGFPAFNEKVAANLSKLIAETNAAIVPATTHHITTQLKNGNPYSKPVALKQMR